MKLPFLQFFTGDWLKDPTVSMLSPAARGIWLDLICTMAEHDRSGSITGTRPALSRLSRCSPDELAGALNELTLCGTAEIHEDSNGLVTVTNRRMRREANSRESSASRQERFRQSGSRNACVTQDVTPPLRPILQSTESRKQSTEPDSDKVFKPSLEGGYGGKPLRGGQADIAAFCERVLTGGWVNDAGKWVNRIRTNADKVSRVMAVTKAAVDSGDVQTTPAQMAEDLWKRYQ